MKRIGLGGLFFVVFFLVVDISHAALPPQIVKELMSFENERDITDVYEVYSYEGLCGLFVQRHPPKDFEDFLYRNGNLVIDDSGKVVMEKFTWSAEGEDIQVPMRRVVCKGVFSGNYGTKKPTKDVFNNHGCVNLYTAFLTSDGSACVKLSYYDGKAQGEPNNASCRMVGNPIDVATGNKFQKEVDFEGVGLARYYNSLSGAWVSSFDYRLVVAGPSQVVTFPDGKVIPFSTALKDKDSLGEGEDGVSGTYYNSFLHADHLVVRGGEVSYKNADGLELKFQKDGRVSIIRRVLGSAISTLVVSYSGNDVLVSDAFGKVLKISNDANGNIKKAEYQGLILEYGYDSKSRLVSVRKRYLDGSEDIRYYHYESPQGDKLLTGITDERGIRVATWSYDEKQNAVLSEHALGANRTEVKYEYSAPGRGGNVFVTNALGAVYKYVVSSYNQTYKMIRQSTSDYPSLRVNLSSGYNANYLEDSGEIYVGESEGSNGEYGGEPQGEITIRRDDFGLETSRTFRGWALGSSSSLDKTTTKDWDGDRLLLNSQTENDRITSYSYDEKGRLIGISESSKLAN